MRLLATLQKKLAVFGIAALCFGYFASYVPYSMLTKLLTSGALDGMNGQGFTGFEIQPVVVTATVVALYVYLTAAGWWKYATHSTVLGFSIPRPQWFTCLAGFCTAGIIITTTLAYTFQGISIVFAMLLMRGGMLVLAPVVDLIVRKRRRTIYWPSWVAATLSLSALFVTFSGKSGTALSFAAALNIGIYLACNLLRLFLMSSFAKSTCLDEKKRFFTEDQMTANAVLWVCVIGTGLIGSTMDPQSLPGQMWSGIVAFPTKGFLGTAIVIGLCSFGAGLFGSLIFLDRRENTFTVPANRVSSVIAGVVASCWIAFQYHADLPPTKEFVGMGLIVTAIIFLAYRSIVEKQQRALEHTFNEKLKMQNAK